MKTNKIILLITLTLILLGITYATENNTDTAIQDNPFQETIKNTQEQNTIKVVTQEKQDNKEIKKQNTENKSTKTAAKTININNFQTLHNTLTSKNYTTLTLNLKSNIKLENKTVINKAIQKVTINGNGKTINGQKKYQFLDIPNKANVIIKNIKIIGCKGAISNEGRLSISNSYLNYNKAKQGGAIGNDGNLTITKSVLNNNKATDSGGAIVNWGKLSISNSNLNNNKVTEESFKVYDDFVYSYDYEGGAIANHGAIITVINSTLNNNSARHGGAIFLSGGYEYGNLIKNCILNNNNATLGGAIYGDAENITITKCKLYNNHAMNGGAICQDYNPRTIYIKDCNLKYNTASQSGGAIYNEGPLGATVNINNSNISNNKAEYGGGIYNGEVGIVTISNSNVNSNKAISQTGGAIYNEAELTITQSNINNNKANIVGGAIYNVIYRGYGPKMTIKHSNLNNNKANGGGAISNYGGYLINTIINTTINNNNAEYDGGAIDNSGKLIIINSLLNNNTATGTGEYGGGGAISNTGDLTITNSTLNKNKAEENSDNGGGAIRNWGNLTITNSTLSNNKASSGGAIHIMCDFDYKNTKNIITLNINNNTFNQNYARKGSAIFINETTKLLVRGKYTNNTNVTITNITNNIFKQNKAKTMGSAIINKGKNTKLINNINVKKSQDSSTIHIVQGTKTLIQSNTFYIPITTKITLTPIKQKTYNDKFIVTGKLTDNKGTLLKNANIKIKLNSKTYTTKTNNKGVYKLKLATYKVGTNNLTVAYAGNSKYGEVTTKTTFKTVARATKLTINKISTTRKGNKVKITGKLTDNTGAVLKNIKLNVKINKKSVSVKTNNKGIYAYTYKTTINGTNNVTVTFPKNMNYKASVVNTNFKVL